RANALSAGTPAGEEPPPMLSVLVTVVEGGGALRGVLQALRQQESPPTLEVLVPVDDSVPDTDALEREFPEVLVVRLGPLQTSAAISSPSGQHELYDRRRAAGLAAARGDLVAIIEDRGHPRADWARTAVRLHAEHGAGVIGGAIEQDSSGLLNWAFWVCDFSRYGLPFVMGPVEWV